MLLSQNRTLTTIPHPMGPPSVTISDCSSGLINKWNLVSFHELGTSLSSIDVYIESCPRSTVLICLWLTFMHQQTSSQPEPTVGLARSSPWPFSAPRARPPLVPSTSTTPPLLSTEWTHTRFTPQPPTRPAPCAYRSSRPQPR